MKWRSKNYNQGERFLGNRLPSHAIFGVGKSTLGSTFQSSFRSSQWIQLGVHAYTWKLIRTWSCKNYLPITMVPDRSLQAAFFKIHLYHAGVVKIICQSPFYQIARFKQLPLKFISSKYTFMYIFQNLLI